MTDNRYTISERHMKQQRNDLIDKIEFEEYAPNVSTLCRRAIYSTVVIVQFRYPLLCFYIFNTLLPGLAHERGKLRLLMFLLLYHIYIYIYIYIKNKKGVMKCL